MKWSSKFVWVIIIDIERHKNRLLKFCYVPATSAAHNWLLFFLFLLRPFTVLMKQTRQVVCAVKQSIFLRCLWFRSSYSWHKKLTTAAGTPSDDESAYQDPKLLWPSSWKRGEDESSGAYTLKCFAVVNCGLYYKSFTIVNDDASVVSKWRSKLQRHLRS